jgi:threonine dehydratase/glutamate/tyrosine decarboxylase-like PLP-dependent enzyme
MISNAMSHTDTPRVDRETIAGTEASIRPFVRRTPTLAIDGADFGLGSCSIVFKLELLQHAGSFKARGAFANMLLRRVPPAGVVAASGGNHGVAVAYAARRLEKPARIFLPSVASPAKIERIREYGAELVVTGERYADALAECQSWAERSGALQIHAFDQVETMLGQGTVGLELEEQAAQLDTLLVAVGGGGLLGGIAAWYAGRVRLIGVEPEEAPTLTSALAAGRPVDAVAGGIAADSLAPKRVGELMFPLAQRHVDRVVLVSDEEIQAAQRVLWDRLRIVTEPGGAAAFAALLARRYQPGPAERVGVLLCGGNTTIDLAAPRGTDHASDPYSHVLVRAMSHATQYLATIHERHVGATATGDELRQLLGGPLSQDGEDGTDVIDGLARAAQDGTTASQGPRYFGFVTGGSLPVATAADWLVSAWDQNAQVYAMSPLASVVEGIAAHWLKDLLGLPADWSVGFVTGAQMANFTALIAARTHVLRQVNWDVERLGLFDAPHIDVIVSDQAHRTIFTALRMLGLGAERLHRVETDEDGRMRTDHLAERLRRGSGPCIVCAQIGNVNTGAADPMTAIASLTRSRGAWLHVDAAFGLWAAASPALRHLVDGVHRADSIATDAHKWLNVPYDSGIVFTAHPESHQRGLLMPAHYIQMTEGERDARAFVPDESRRARGVAVYAALRTLGRRGVTELVDRCCHHARRMADALRRHAQVQILNDVLLNQVLVRFAPLPGDARDDGAFTMAVVAAVQDEGTCWLGSTEWQGRPAMRISICNWSTTGRDIDRSAAAILRIVDESNVKLGPHP